ncbi:MAG: ribosome maturation factor RimM [Cyanobacteria bacterium P01_H01_bin.15]
MASQDWLQVGRIVSAQGLMGEVRIYPNSDFPERFLSPGERWLQPPTQSPAQKFTLLQGRYLPKKNLYVIKFAEICDRNQAEALKNYQLLADPADKFPLDTDEYHVQDLLGLRVILQETQLEIGILVDVRSAGNDLLEVRLADTNTQVLIPFVKEIVPTVDVQAGFLEITPPPGLLDLSTGS